MFQYDVGTPDTIGGNAANWTPFLTVWAAVEPLSSRELIQGGMIRPDTTHKIIVRYRPGFHAAMRVLFGTLTGDLSGASPVGCRVFHLTGPPLNTETVGRELVMLCKEQETVT